MNKSYLKWCGSKSRILEEVLATFPPNIETFAEPFTGSCTVALNVEARTKLLNDSNRDLISTHVYAYSNPDQLLTLLEGMYTLGRDSYYLIRQQFNISKLSQIKLAAAFIYLNKHGFNGLCRYSKKSGFNVPVGKSKTVNYPEKEITQFKNWLNSETSFYGRDFKTFCSLVPDNSVVYCDPPYVPKSTTLSNINYTGEQFTWDNHKQLKQCVLELQARGCHVVVSNHNLPIIRDLYKDADEIRTVSAFRSISSKNNRGQVNELLAIFLPN